MSAVLRVAIDGGTWTNQRGYGRFTRELVGALASSGRHEYTLVLDAHAGRLGEAAVPSGVTLVSIPLTGSPSIDASANGWRSPLDLWRMSRALSSARADLVFFPSVYTFVPLMRRVATVVTIHDVIAERFPSLIFSTARARLFWQAKVWAARAQAHRILTVSEHAARGVRDVFGVPSTRLRVTGEAPAAVFRRIDDRAAVTAAMEARGLEPDMEVVAYVGGLSPHKNLGALIRTFTRLVAELPERRLHLLLIGDYEHDVFLSDYPALRTLIDRDCQGRVTLTGRLEDAEIALLLNGVRAFVLPSFDEGFGLPAVEAAACGAAVIATRASAMPEVLGDAALYIDPSLDDSVHEALHRVLTDDRLRQDLGARGALRATALTWRSAAQTVEEVFDELAVSVGEP